MIFNKLWLDELVPNSLSVDKVSDIITMAGLEVDSVEPVTGEFTNVVVGEVLTCVAHPDSDHLHVTTVKVGDNEILDIVCGAPNCRAGLKVACAKVGAVLPGDFKIKPAKLRGVPSNGMLCSYKELGLSDESNGIIEFPSDAPVGTDIHDYLKLNDNAVVVDLTANRSDCLSVRGIAREFGVLTNTDVKYPEIKDVASSISDTYDVKVENPEACPRYISRIIKNVDLSRPSPLWMQERLRRCGMRSVDAIVDVTNYVMLEIGQPMHAFDLDSLKGTLKIRNAKDGEKITLLSGQEATLKSDTLLCSDDCGPVALAGIFGGARTGVKKDSKNILLESAFFAPSAIKNRARSYGLDTEAAHRFERGVDWKIQKEAMERATQFILDICGGEAGPVNEVCAEASLPKSNKVTVSYNLVKEVIGIDIPKNDIVGYLDRLGMAPVATDNDVTVVSPSWRYDIEIPEDICEEIARMYGYDRIPNICPLAPLRMVLQHEADIKPYKIKSFLADLGYHEVVTYSFVDEKSLKAIVPDVEPIILPKPITKEMSAMRTTLWAGLINTVVYNLNRQATNLRFFETGLTFISDKDAENGIRQEEMVGGVICGNFAEESWSRKTRPVDFFDLKGDVEKLIELTGNTDAFAFEKANIPALHPGVSAALTKDGKVVGYLGLIHPSVQKALGLKQKVFLFQIKMSALNTRVITNYQDFSKFPSIRRDYAIVIDKNVTADDLVACIKKQAGSYLKQVNIFDHYVGEGIPEGKKSIAFSVELQALDKTLDDKDIADSNSKIIDGLKSQFAAELRE